VVLRNSTAGRFQLQTLKVRTHELSESLEQQTATSEVLKIISSSPGELEPVFEAMLENAVRICGAKFGNLWLREGDAFRIGAMHGAPPAYADFFAPHACNSSTAGTCIGRVASTKQVAHIADVKVEPAYAKNSPVQIGTVELAGARTVVAVPMLKDDELIGAIVIYRQEVRPFTDKQIELVSNSPRRPSLPSRTRDCLVNCANRCDNRSLPLTSSKSSAALRSSYMLMTLSTSAVAVCRWRDSRSSLSSRVFSMAMTAWSAKVLTSSICFAV